jgi:hypothetical protein
MLKKLTSQKLSIPLKISLKGHAFLKKSLAFSTKNLGAIAALTHTLFIVSRPVYDHRKKSVLVSSSRKKPEIVTNTN